MLHHTRTLCSFYLSFLFKTFVSTLKKKEVFPQNSDLSSSHLIVSLRSILTPLHLCTFAPLHYLILLKHFAISHCSEPASRTTSHSLVLCQETISLLQNHTPQNHIGFTLRSPIFTDPCRILGTSFWSPPRGSFSKLVPSVHKTNPFRSTHTISKATIAHAASHTAPYI